MSARALAHSRRPIGLAVLATLGACALSGCQVGLVAVIAVFSSQSSGRRSVNLGVAPPTLASVTPDEASHAGGTVILLVGTRFPADATVSVGGTDATGVIASSSTVLTAVLPRYNGVGSVDVVVTNPRGGSATLVNGFTYTNSTPAATIANLATPQSGNIVVSFTLLDAESDPVNVLLEIDTGSGFQTVPPGQIIGDDVLALETTPAGVLHTLPFDSRARFGNANLTGVRFRVTPIDAIDQSQGAGATSNSFNIVNADPPTVQLEQNGNSAFHVTLNYTFEDLDPEHAFSITALTWADLSTGTSGDIAVASGQGVGPIAGGSGTMLTTVWNSVANIGLGNNHLVTVSVTLTDGFTSYTATSTPFLVSNGPLSDPIPLALVEVVAGLVVGDVSGDGRPDLVAGSGGQFNGGGNADLREPGPQLRPGNSLASAADPRPGASFPGVRLESFSELGRNALTMRAPRRRWQRIAQCRVSRLRDVPIAALCQPRGHPRSGDGGRFQQLRPRRRASGDARLSPVAEPFERPRRNLAEHHGSDRRSCPATLRQWRPRVRCDSNQ